MGKVLMNLAGILIVGWVIFMAAPYAFLLMYAHNAT
jgi:hypothetical protein